MLLVVELLKKKLGSGRKKGARWLLGSDYRNGVTILRVKPAEHIIKHLACLTNGRTRRHSLTEGISKQFETATVLVDGHVALIKVTEHGLQVHAVVELVVA